jgi:hypothetical protein
LGGSDNVGEFENITAPLLKYYEKAIRQYKPMANAE